MERLSVARDEKEDSPRIANLDKQIQVLQREQEGWLSVTFETTTANTTSFICALPSQFILLLYLCLFHFTHIHPPNPHVDLPRRIEISMGT